MLKTKFLPLSKGIEYPYVWAYCLRNKRPFYHAFVSSSFIFPSLYSIYFFAHQYILFLSLPWSMCLNNEHEECQETYLKFDFEGTLCTDGIDSGKDMDDEPLPFEMMRLMDNEDKQILPHQKVNEIINLGSKNEKK